MSAEAPGTFADLFAKIQEKKRSSVDVQVVDNLDVHKSSDLDVHITEQDVLTSTIVKPSDVKTPTITKPGRPEIEDVDVQKSDKYRTGKGRLTLRPEKKILKQFKVFCAQQGITITEFFELAGVQYMQTVDVHSDTNVDVKTPLDERRTMMLFKTRPSIINLYLRYNPLNRWKSADDREAGRFNETDERVIELGIIQTLSNAGFKRVHSFKYFIPEIEQYQETPFASETLDTILRLNRKRFEAFKSNLMGKGSN